MIAKSSDMTTTIIFGTCNHLFIKQKSKQPTYNLLKIYPEDAKADIAYLGKKDDVPSTSTLTYGQEPPKRPPRRKKIKASQNEEVSDQDKLTTQVSVEGNSLLCGCLPKSPKSLVKKLNKTDNE